jgi:Zn-dependent protease with chaperone function
MDFFENQEQARKKTALLLFLYVFALSAVIVLIYLATNLSLHLWKGGVFRVHWDLRLFMLVSPIVAAIILFGSVYQYNKLSEGGGDAVAQMLGAVPVGHGTEDILEQRLLNIVQEMSLAAALPMPRVYIMKDDASINAFAAGLTQNHAVVAVTRGSLEQLSRDELQGVIAHEFSHILNGDMRLNMQLMGIIGGLTVIHFLGRLLFEITGRSTNRRSGNAGLVILVMGLLLMAAGWLGVLFSQIIKSAVSRQREFLADAAAVQFTRNPSGIAGALKKIAGWTEGTRIKSVRAQEASHIFFSNTLTGVWQSLFATHPAIEVRIQRIDPRSEYQHAAGEGRAAAASASGSVSSLAGTTTRPSGAPVTAEKIISSVGTPDAYHVSHASKMLAGLPGTIKTALSDSAGACSLVYCMLLNKEEAIRSSQLQWLEQQEDKEPVEKIAVISPVMDSIGREHWMPLVDLAIPVLRGIPPAQYASFKNNVQHLAEADRDLSLFEYTLQCTLLRRIESSGTKTGSPPKIMYNKPSHIEEELRLFFSILAWNGSADPAAVSTAFGRATAMMKNGKKPLSILPKEQCNIGALDVALGVLHAASPQLKQAVLRATVECISDDSRVTVDEAELLRAVADAMDCPVPPLVPGVIGQASSDSPPASL